MKHSAYTSPLSHFVRSKCIEKGKRFKDLAAALGKSEGGAGLMIHRGIINHTAQKLAIISSFLELDSEETEALKDANQKTLEQRDRAAPTTQTNTIMLEGNLGQMMRLYKARYSISSREIARGLGISDATLSKQIHNGIVKDSDHRIEKIGEIMGLMPEEVEFLKCANITSMKAR